MNLTEPALDYRAFLEAKVKLDHACGFEIDPADLNPALKDHTRAMVRWALAGGRRALFAAFGLHKTCAQLEIMRLVGMHRPGLRLITVPLGVRQEFFRDARERFAGDYALRLKFIRRVAEIEDERTIYLTNYESVREGILDIGAMKLGAVSLDEASVLRGFGGTKTFREAMAVFAGDDRRDRSEHVKSEGVPFRFVATATPSPNEYIEILAYAAFLGIMDVGQAKTRFFKRNSEKADALTLHPHKEAEFWLWVASWALFVQRPSDLGFSDDGYALPELDVRWHELPSDHASAGTEKDGQGRMFRNAAIGVQDAAKEKRDSLPARVEKLLDLRAEDPGAHRLLWHDLEDERRALEAALPEAVYGHWQEFRDGDPRALAIFDRHYTSKRAHLRKQDQFVGPGQKLVLLTAAADALFAWRKHISDDGQHGVNCAVFRNEGPLLSSELILEAMAIAWQRWPSERFYTYVDPGEIESSNPGYCFLMAGWQRCGTTKDGLVILEALPGVTVPDVSRRQAFATVYGSQDLDEREQLVRGFADGEIPELGGKPIMLGSGTNMQRHCSWAIYLGITFKFNDVIQSIHRLQRFGQTKRVRIDLIYTEAEREIRRDLERKWAQHVEMVGKMTSIIREYGLSNASMAHALTRTIGIERTEASGKYWSLVNSDCVEETQRMPSDSVDLIVTSIPFSHQYEYSPSYNDFGHTDDNAHFWRQMDFLTPQLLRVLQPGRVCAIHVKDRITPGGINGFGFQSVSRISDACADHFERHGFAFLGRVTIVTDVVRENNQTYRLGWTEQCKDGSRMGKGLPEYVMLFRKPPTDRSNGYADLPVVKDKKSYTRARWQYDAHGMWRSSGKRMLQPEDLDGLEQQAIFKLFRKYSLENVYEFSRDVKIAEHVDKSGWLPSTFMLLQPASWHPDVWTDVTRMRTLNSTQSAKGKEMHLCPIPFDIVDRLITQFSMDAETVFDPFVGIGTVACRAVRLGRKAIGVELNERYFKDATFYCAAEEANRSIPSLFDLLEEHAEPSQGSHHAQPHARSDSSLEDSQANRSESSGRGDGLTSLSGAARA